MNTILLGKRNLTLDKLVKIANQLGVTVDIIKTMFTHLDRNDGGTEVK